MMRALKKLIKNKLTKIQIFIKKKLRMIRLLMKQLFKIFNRFKKFKAHQVTNKIQISVGNISKFSFQVSGPTFSGRAYNPTVLPST